MAAAVGAAVAWWATGEPEPVEGVIDVNGAPPPPVVGFKAGAGLGKTGCALEQIAAIPGVEQLNVEIYVPGHKLAEELAQRARSAAPGLRVRVIKGRGDPKNPEAALCQKAELAEAIGRSGLNVMGSLCRLKDRRCEFEAGCRYLAQFRDSAPAIRIMAHAAMFAQRNKDLPRPDLVVVDESFWSGSLVHQRLALDRLTEVERWRARLKKTKRAKNETPEEAIAEAFAQVKARKEAADRLLEAEDFARRVRSAFEDGRDPRTVVTAEDCRIVAAVEWGSRSGPGITPDLPHAQQKQLWASWRNDECTKAGRFWNLLEAEHEHPERPIQRIVLERDAETRDGDRRHLLHLHYRRELRLPAVPVILLDADLDPVIASKFWPTVRVVDIPVRQQAHVVQVIDRSCSMRFLLGGGEDDQPRADRRLAELQRTALRLLGDGGLLVTYKAALERLELPAEIDAVHLGDLRGRDGYKHHDVAVVAGRLEPSVEMLERIARGLFGDEAAPLQIIEPDANGLRRYPTEQRRYRMGGGGILEENTGPAVDVSVHPDTRAEAILEQIREREVEQAVARLRLVHRDRRATIWLLTNVPLDLEVAELVTWNALARDREGIACRRWAGVWLCSPGERAKAAPDLWPSQGAVRQGERRKGCTESSRLNPRAVRTPFPPYPAWGSIGLNREAATLVSYRRPGHQRGSPHRAYVPGSVWCTDTARADLEAVTGPVATVTILGTIRRDQPGVIVSSEDPAPLAVPIAANEPLHVIGIDAAWAFSGGRERWTLAVGNRLSASVWTRARSRTIGAAMVAGAVGR